MSFHSKTPLPLCEALYNLFFLHVKQKDVDKYPEGVYYTDKDTHRGYTQNKKEMDEIMKKEEAACPACRTKERSEAEYKDLINRLSRIEGQIRGIKRMIENNAYCIDVLNQVSAANCALNSFNKVLLSNHIKSCVVDDVREGNDEKLDELVRTLQKLMK